MHKQRRYRDDEIYFFDLKLFNILVNLCHQTQKDDDDILPSELFNDRKSEKEKGNGQQNENKRQQQKQ